MSITSRASELGSSLRTPYALRRRAYAAAKRVGIWLGLPVALVTAWWFASAGSTDFYRPSLRRIMQAFAETWFGPRLVEDVLPSLARLAVGYAIALLLGIALGVAIGSSVRTRAVTEPALEFLRAIPPPILVPVIMLFAGIDDGMKVIVIVFGCIWPILLNAVEGVRATDEVLTDTCRVYGVNPLRHLIVRAASPQIMTGARQALSIGIILMVISEMVAASSGLGFTVVQFQRGFQIPEMWSGVLLLGLIGVTLAAIFRFAEHKILGWYHGSRDADRR
ncbi:MAG TPA: ABC transporter permease [Candidatus Limnocylindrales bacterium]|nr:ABC transporter permease [Candidatus Limnocylindrales bacterium]